MFPSIAETGILVRNAPEPENPSAEVTTPSEVIEPEKLCDPVAAVLSTPNNCSTLTTPIMLNYLDL